MTQKDFASKDLQGKPIKLILKNKLQKIGYIVGFTNNEDFNMEFMMFCLYDKQDEFQKFIKQKLNINSEDLNQFIEHIRYSDIESYEKLESEISTMVLANDKPIPTWLTVQMEFNGKPGFVRIKYGPPKNYKMFDLGELQIKDSKIVLPILLAFLSYAREDGKRVERIMNKLHDHGILTWYDKREILPGDTWENKIKHAIEKSDFVFIFLSSKTIEREGYKNKEIRYALEQGQLKPFGKRYIIPILLDKCNPPSELKDFQWLSAWGKNWFEKLLTALGKNKL